MIGDIKRFFQPRILFYVAAIFAAIVFTLFAHWEMTHESWQYWFFARILRETGRFVILDRSPLYILYLQLFRWMGYPNMVTVEYVVTAVITSLVLVFFLRKYLTIPVAVFGVILWIPYMQISEPSVQKLAVAACLAGVMFRQKNQARRNIAFSYLFFIAAYLLRSSYGGVLAIYAVYDLLKFLKIGHMRRIRIIWKDDWPVIAGILFYFLVIILQSPHRWNNVWGATTAWFPSGGKSFNILQNYNASYIMERYGSYQDHDFYESNKEVFGGAKDTASAIRANPEFFRRIAWEYTKVGTPIFTRLTKLPILFGISNTDVAAHTLLLGGIFFGAFMATQKTLTTLYVAGVAGMVGLTFLFLPNNRYFVAVIPALLLSASWYAGIVNRTVLVFFQKIRVVILQRYTQKIIPIVYLGFVLLFSLGSTSSDFSGVYQATWPNLIRTITEDWEAGALRVMEFRDTSVYFPPAKSAYKSISALFQKCLGIMTLEYTFLGAFTDIPVEKIYDIWEIPPFGNFDEFKPVDQSTPHLWGGEQPRHYYGLRPDRINCLFISKNLKYGVGAATNSALRYHGYIKPYSDYLIGMGAIVQPIEGYGEAITL